MFPKVAYKNTDSFTRLAAHFQSISAQHMRQLFAEDPGRSQEFSIEYEGLLFDFSKQKVTSETMALLYKMAGECQLPHAILSMFKGEHINETENRAVLHTALRNRSGEAVWVDGKDVMPNIKEVLAQMGIFSDALRSGEWLGYTGKKITDVVNIGIGGSDLGPAMVCHALKPYAGDGPNVHFVSNVDGTHLTECLRGLDHASTLFIIASKTFTTQETMANAHSARTWFLQGAKVASHIGKHFVAVSTARKEVVEFGIASENIFTFWDWVGGRYSLWSAIGLSIMTYIGKDHFNSLLDGAFSADQHFQKAAFENNIPVNMALLGIWNTEFFHAGTHAVLPYDQYLEKFPAYLQQADMESNGKQVDRNGDPVTYPTGPVVWGEPGTNGQHAFYQLIHQGTQTIPCDFIVPVISQNELGQHHQILLSHCLAQSEAMMRGKTMEEVKEELLNAGMDAAAVEHQAPFRVFNGDIPSNTFVLPELSPFQLGLLIALYEHKIFVQGVLWNIFSFDQWGVELGKKLAATILPELESGAVGASHDSSTQALIKHITVLRKKLLDQ